MKIYDVSLTVSPRLALWPGDPPVRIERVKSMDDGAEDNVSRMCMGAHTGTHVDAPLHFIAHGGDVTQLALDALTGEAYVLHLPDVAAITAEVLERQPLPEGAARLLFHMRNSELWARGDNQFATDFVALTPDAAQWIVDHHIRLVGVDYLSVGRYHQDGAETHRLLLAAGVVVVEGLDLSRIVPGCYDFYCLPLKLAGAEGAPARAILVAT